MVQCIRKWQIFPGKNRILCDGRIIMARQTGVFYITILIILTTSILFFAFDCPYLARHLSLCIPIVAIFILGFVLCTLLRTSFIDPGIIPRASAQEAEYITKHVEGAAGGDGGDGLRMGLPNAPRYKEVFINGQLVKLKYCFTCKIFRPPRASHCSLCDNCVERFDHHCPWVGNCVGKRNYRFFYMFLLSLTILCIYILAFSITHMVLLMKTHNFIDSVRTTPASLIVAIICFFSIWSVLGLTGFHTYLSTSEQTTNEDIKGTFSSRKGRKMINPYSKGSPVCNWFNVICGPMPPSLIDLRGRVDLPQARTNTHPGEGESQVVTGATTVPLEVMDRMKVYVELLRRAGPIRDEGQPDKMILRNGHPHAHENAIFDCLPNGNANANNNNANLYTLGHDGQHYYGTSRELCEAPQSELEPGKRVRPSPHARPLLLPSHHGGTINPAFQNILPHEERVNCNGGRLRSYGSKCGASGSLSIDNTPSPPSTYVDSKMVILDGANMLTGDNDAEGLAERAISPIFNYGTMASSSFNALIVSSSDDSQSMYTRTSSSRREVSLSPSSIPALPAKDDTSLHRALLVNDEPDGRSVSKLILSAPTGEGKKIKRRKNDPPKNLSLQTVPSAAPSRRDGGGMRVREVSSKNSPFSPQPFLPTRNGYGRRAYLLHSNSSRGFRFFSPSPSSTTGSNGPQQQSSSSTEIEINAALNTTTKHVTPSPLIMKLSSV